MSRAAREGKRVRSGRSACSLHALLIAGALVMLYPLLWLASSSLKPAQLDLLRPRPLAEARSGLENYVDGWRGAALPFSIFFINSFIIAGARGGRQRARLQHGRLRLRAG